MLNLLHIHTFHREIRKEEHTHMNKNAYEIRLDILRMAHEEEMMLFNLKFEQLNRLADIQQNVVSQDVIDSLRPTTAKVLARANELYTFVDGQK